jgi:hypothetical protein
MAASTLATDHIKTEEIDDQSVLLYRKAVEVCDSEDEIEGVLALAFDDENVRQYLPRDPKSGDPMTPRSFMVAVQPYVKYEFHRTASNPVLQGSPSESSSLRVTADTRISL